MYPKLPFLFRPYFLLELPGWGRLYRWLGIPGVDNLDPRWQQAPTLACKGKHTKYKMTLRLSDDVERGVYFLGRYYDLQNQLLLNKLLEPGDTFFDIGANVGLTTLHAASLTLPKGRVIAVEPQPDCCKRILDGIKVNGLENIEVHNVAVGEQEEELELKVLGGGTIMATLADGASGRQNARNLIKVPVVLADQIIGNNLPGKLVIKMDVEGFELYALRGLKKTINKYRPPIMVEIDQNNLERAGVNAQQIFDFLNEFGYKFYAIGLTQHRFRRPTLSLRTISNPKELNGDIDMLCVAENSDQFDPSIWILK